MKRFSFALTFFALFILTLSSCRQQQPWNEVEIDGESLGYEGESGGLSIYDVSGNSITLQKDYDVSAKLAAYQDDKTKHREMWNAVTALFPVENRTPVRLYEVFHGGGEILGYVTPVNDNIEDWVFALDIYSAYPDGQFNSDGEFTYTTIHEYGHIMTLNDTQLDDQTSEDNCSNYHPGEGCATNSAYIGQFYDTFWADIWNEYNDLREGEIYDRYPDRFVTEYAATNPAEDIAESFTMFALQDRPTSTFSMSDRKIQFFYNYPELVELREHIREQTNLLPTVSAKTISHKLQAQRGGCIRHQHNH